MSEEFKWWYGLDRESWQGPVDTRDEAISEGHSTYENESFYICEAKLEDYFQLTIDPDEVLEQVSDRYIEFAGDDPLFSAVNPTQNIELGRKLTQVLHEWIDEFDVKTGIIMFNESRNEELIERK